MNGAQCTGAGWSKEGTGNLPSARVRKAPMQINAQFEVAVPSSFSLSRSLSLYYRPHSATGTRPRPPRGPTLQCRRGRARALERDSARAREDREEGRQGIEAATEDAQGRRPFFFFFLPPSLSLLCGSCCCISLAPFFIPAPSLNLIIPGVV